MENGKWRIENVFKTVNSLLILFFPSLPDGKEIKSKRFKIFMSVIIILLAVNIIYYLLSGK
jgi:hypothetical protein